MKKIFNRCDKVVEKQNRKERKKISVFISCNKIIRQSLKIRFFCFYRFFFRCHLYLCDFSTALEFLVQFLSINLVHMISFNVQCQIQSIFFCTLDASHQNFIRCILHSNSEQRFSDIFVFFFCRRSLSAKRQEL